MRNLPTKRSYEHEVIIRAVQDFWNEGITRRVINASLWIMGRRRGVELNEEEKDAVWYVLNNISDKNYCKNLLEA